MATLQSQLILSLINRVTGPARAVANSVKRLQAASQANAAQLDAMRSRMLGAVATAYVLKNALSAPIEAAIAFESAMADVNKVVDFDTPDGFAQMSKDILEMSKRVPMAAKDIASIVAAAGQAGMKGNELLGFAEMAAKVGVAFDISADLAGESLAKIKTALGMTVDETSALADAINHLSNNSAAAAPDLLDFMRSVGSTGKQYGFAAEETAAIGAAMIAAGADSNVAATSFRNMGRALAKGESATKAQRQAYKSLGLSAVDVAKRLDKDAVGTMQDVVARIRKLPKYLQATKISQLFGDEARALMPLIENAKLLDDALSNVAQQQNFLGSSQKECDVRAQTSANAMQLFRNQLEALSIAIGSALLPAITQVMSVIGPYVNTIAELASAHPQVTAAVIGLAAGLIALRIAAIGARWSFLFMKGGMLDAGIIVAKSAGLFLSLLNPLKLVTGAMRVLKVAVIGTGIGAIIVGIAAAGTLIYNNWSGISAMFAAFGTAFMAALGPVRPMMDPVIALAKKLYDIWTDLTGTLSGGDAAWAAFGESAGTAIGNVVKWFAELPAKIIAAIGSIDIGKFITWPKLPWWLGGKGGAAKAANDNANGAVAGARAAGGNITGGRTYLVGEYGPELVTPSRSGYVHDAAATAGMGASRGSAGGGAARSGNSVNLGGVSIQIIQQPGEDAQALAAKINEALGRLAQDGIDGGQFDQEWSAA